MKMFLLPLLAFIVFAASYFTVWQKDMSFPLVSSFSTFLFALPALIGVIKWLGVKRGILLFLSLGAFSYAIEAIGLLTSFPYGQFSYNTNVGILISNFIPVSLPFAWAPLIISAFVLALKFKDNPLKHYAVSLFYIVAIDSVLDPGAIFLGFWTYSENGLWYGVPLTNYFGWIISGTCGFFIVKYLSKKTKDDIPSYILWSYFLSLVFWTGVCFFSKIWGGSFIGIVMIIILYAKQVMTKNKYVL